MRAVPVRQTNFFRQEEVEEIGRIVIENSGEREKKENEWACTRPHSMRAQAHGMPAAMSRVYA